MSLSVPATTLFQIENALVLLAVNDEGNLVVLKNKETGFNYAGGCPLWRLYLQNESELDVELSPVGCNPVITADHDRLTMHYPQLLREGIPIAIAVTIEAWLQDDDVCWSIALSNREPGLVVRECQFPLVGGLHLDQTPELITSQNGGEKIPDLRGELASKNTQFMAPDHLFVGFTVNYPFPASTNSFVLNGPEQGLYFGCHHYPVDRTLHLFRLYPEDGVEAGFARFPMVADGEQWTCQTFVTSPYRGTWHVAARKYRSWADTWFSKPSPPDWVKRLNGWQRIIMQHQYGAKHYTYRNLPQIWADGELSGINTLFMFGWHLGGHDNNYPDYRPDPRLGTEEELRSGIDHFNRNGGHVLLYANGRLIDTASQFYRTIGHRISIKDFTGNELRESYEFRGAGNFVAEFARRSFVIACPSCQEWLTVLKGLAEQALAWNCHSLFLDQAGSAEYPCCDNSHEHPPLWMGSVQAKAETLHYLRDYLRARNPQMALGIELLTDVTAQYVDYVHGLTGGCIVDGDWEKEGSKPNARGFLDWFRYAFPEVILSDREIRDDRDIERRVNHALLKGLRSDVEIYRCRKTIAEAPRYAEWLAQVNQLRQEHADLLLEGRYVDVEGFSYDNQEVDARAFCRGDEMATVITQSHLPSTRVSVTAPGFSLERWSAVGSGEVFSSEANLCSLTLPRHALVVLRWRRDVRDNFHPNKNNPNNHNNHEK